MPKITADNWQPFTNPKEIEKFKALGESMHKEFEVHMLNEDGKRKAAHIATEFDLLLTKLEDIIPDPSREMSIIKTKLEEACFFAKKAMAKLPGNQQ